MSLSKPNLRRRQFLRGAAGFTLALPVLDSLAPRDASAQSSPTQPRFVVMTSISKGTTCGQIFYDFYWGNGFLPPKYGY